MVCEKSIKSLTVLRSGQPSKKLLHLHLFYFHSFLALSYAAKPFKGGLSGGRAELATADEHTPGENAPINKGLGLFSFLNS